MVFDRDATSLNHPLVAHRPRFGNYVHAKRSVNYNIAVNIKFTDTLAAEQIPLAQEWGWFRTGARLTGGTLATFWGYNAYRLVELMIEHGFHVNWTDIPAVDGHVSFAHTFMTHHAVQLVPMVLGFVGSRRNPEIRIKFEQVVNRPALAWAVWKFVVWLKIEDWYPMTPPDDKNDTPPKFIISLHSKEEYDKEVNGRLKRIRKKFANAANVKRRRERRAAAAAELEAANLNDSDDDPPSSDNVEDQDDDDVEEQDNDEGDASASNLKSSDDDDLDDSSVRDEDERKPPAKKPRRRRLSQ